MIIERGQSIIQRSQRHYPVPLANDTRNHRLLALPIQHDPRAALSSVDFFQLIQRNFVLPPPIKVDHRMRNYCAQPTLQRAASAVCSKFR